jgi:DNA-binding NarL/FixJ family response regulator
MDSTVHTAVVLDQFPMWLEAVECVVTSVGIEVVGKTVDTKNALELIEDRQPDLLVADVGICVDEGEGAKFLRRIREVAPDIKVIVLSRVDEIEHVDAALTAGAAACVLKSAHPDDLGMAIRQTFAQSVYFAEGRNGRGQAPRAVAAPRHKLTRRECEILRLVAEGHSNGQLAKKLWVTEQTVKFHLSNIYRKLGVANRTEASHWAHVNNLVPEDASEEFSKVA